MNEEIQYSCTASVQASQRNPGVRLNASVIAMHFEEVGAIIEKDQSHILVLADPAYERTNAP